jgi:serine/threonine protein kinase
MTDMLGSVIAHYRLDKVLGDGGMGTVYRAFDLNLERPISLKLMHSHFARQPEFRARLEQEAKTAARLDHPSIVRILDFGQHEENLYIAMEYIGGGSLRAHLGHVQTERRYLPIRQSLQIGAQIADALDYAHAKGVVHRDVKPSNIILKRLERIEESEGFAFRAVLTDFGLVKLLDGDSMTKVGTTMGTPTYMSPEQCEGAALDGRSDLYSLGVVLYELVTNRLPFEFKSLSEAMGAHMRGEKPVPARQLRDDLPVTIEAILDRVLAKDPAGRFSTGSEMAEDLRSASYSFDESPTQIVTRDEEAPSRGIPLGFRLMIDAPGHEISYAAMNREEISIGRNPDNDIVLPAEGISRRNSLIRWSATGWQLEDLGGINGTWLDGKRLTPGDIVDIKRGSRIEIGPYAIVIETEILEELPAAIAAGAGAAAAAIAEEAEIEPLPESPLALFLAREELEVEPGRETELLLEVVNRGDLDDRVNPKIQGLPSNWVKLPDSFIKVGAGETATIPLTIHPPRHSDSQAGRHRFRIVVISQRYGGTEPSISGAITVSQFESFEMTMEPRRFKLPETVRVTIRNTGNSDNDFSIIGRNPEDLIRIKGERGRLILSPRQTATVDLRFEQPRRNFFGPKKESSFSIEVATTSGARQSIRGKASIAPVLPAGVLYIVLFFFVFACVLVLIGFIVQRSRAGSDGLASENGLSGLEATATAAAATSTALSGGSAIIQETQRAATAIASGDRDGDGLSDTQEQYLGSDQNNPDSDQDLLEDGEEVLTWGTSPTNRDTDGDKLSDGEEVRSIGTNPTLPDSDGDGILDGDEIIMGSDPLFNDAPPATATPIPQFPTETPLPELPTSPPTETSAPADTPTAQPTDTPSPPPTLEPSATPTEIPTEPAAPTETSTPAPSGTPLPALELTCSSIPPDLDGSVTTLEWGIEPFLAFVPEQDNQRRVFVYGFRNAEKLYLAAVIGELTPDIDSDSFAIYFDTNDSSGDPDSADRLFYVGRNGTMSLWSGIGDNQDGETWEQLFDGQSWTAYTADVGTNSWSLEMEIDLAAEMPQILVGPSFGSLILVDFTGSQATWPEGADTTNTGTWQRVLSDSCE